MRRPSRRRIIIATLITVVSVAILLAIAGPLIATLIDKKVKERLEQSDAKIGSLHINLFTRSITIKDFQWERNSKKVSVKNIYAGGIRIIPLLREKKVSLRRIVIEDGDVEITRDTVQRPDKVDSVNLKSIDVDRITISNIGFKLKKDTVVEFEARIGIIFSHISLDTAQNFKDPSAYRMADMETTVENFRLHSTGSLNALKIQKATFNKGHKRVHIDSLELEPLLSKADFAKAVKSSSDTRVSLSVGSIDAEGVSMAIHADDTAFMVKSLTVDHPVVHAYKNKKYPWTRTKKFPLPMVSFSSLPWGIEVDTIRLQNGEITYEELPLNGFHYAFIAFQNVEAKMSTVNNRAYINMPDHALLTATANVMKTGEINASFKLPLDPKKKYSAEGTLKNFPLKELNPLLQDLAFVEIESGRMNKLDFAFIYDDIGSVGQVHFDYQDLKINGLKKQRKKDISPFKTALINTAVKNDQTINGSINVVRDQTKAVFNLWTISVVDGIKSGMIPINTSRKGKDKNKDKKKN